MLFDVVTNSLDRHRLTATWYVNFAVSGSIGILVAIACIAVLGDGLAAIPAGFSSFLLALPFVGFMTTSLVVDLRRIDRKTSLSVLTLLYFLTAHLCFGLGTGTWSLEQAVRLAAYVVAPLLLIALSQNKPAVTVWDLAAVLAIWLPIEFKWTAQLWQWPKPHGAGPLHVLMATSLAIVCFGAIRQMPWVRLRLRIRISDILIVSGLLTTFLIIAIPFGLATEFIVWDPAVKLTELTLMPFAICFLVALPEELLFRGLMQSFLIRQLGSTLAGVAITAVVFGVSHANNGDWRFVVLATIAGVFYGYAYVRTEHLAAPVFLHTATNVLWLWFFM